jgi:WD40 repeat protein
VVPTAAGDLVMSLAFSSDGESVMAGFGKGDVRLWRLNRSTNSVAFLGHKFQVRGIALSPDGQTLYTAAEDIRLWDVRTSKQKSLLTPRPGYFYCSALSPDGRRLAAGGSEALVTIWDLTSLQEVATLKGHGDSVMQLAFTPDGNNLVSVSRDQFRVWRAASTPEKVSKKIPEIIPQIRPSNRTSR